MVMNMHLHPVTERPLLGAARDSLAPAPPAQLSLTLRVPLALDPETSTDSHTVTGTEQLLLDSLIRELTFSFHRVCR